MHKTMGAMSISDLRRTGRLLNTFAKPRRLLVYWVPHAYGHRALNVAFCVWLWIRSVLHRDRIELMIQECFLEFSWRPWKRCVAASIQRLMMVIIMRSAGRIWGALPAFESQLRPYSIGRRIPFGWLPVPSNVPVVPRPDAIVEIRRRFASHGMLIGHFGTYASSITGLLERIVPQLLRETNSSLVLLGSGGHAFRERLVELCPEAAERVHATGFLDDAELSCWLSACDFLVQPYPDGVTARRGSILAAMAHARPVITNVTPRSESFWVESGAAVLVPGETAFLAAVRRLCDDSAERERIGRAARETYLRYFDPMHMVKAVQEVSA